MRKIKLGIIGLGNIGAQHYRNILDGKCPEIDVTAVCDINPDRFEWVRNTYAEYQPDGKDIPFPEMFSDASEMIKSGACEAIVIAVPHYDHPRYAIEAFKHGIHVMCEKPAGVYTLQVREMIAEADRHPELKFGMMFNQRTNCVYRKMKEILDSGELGEIRRSSWIITNWYRPQAYYNSSAWRATWAGEGGGVLLNQCPHNLDLWQWLCGMPSRVYAKIGFGKWHDIEVDDEASAIVEYPNGATGSFITSTADFPGTNRLEIVCDQGSLICEDNKITMNKLSVSESAFTKVNKSPYEAPGLTTVSVETDNKNEQHPAVLNAFAAAILRDEPLVADGREGINALLISNAMHLSAWTGREVELPFDEDLFKSLLDERIKTSKKKENTTYIFSEFNKTHKRIL
jgi:predicted dehydrogenase